jgi:diguanylate cyclase (GGDEF)-like protein
MMMPGVDGNEVCRRLRADDRTATLAIVMVTALSGADDVVRALSSGADDYVTKPFDPQVLVERVRAVIRRGRLLVEASPLTGLPGNGAIDHRLAGLLAETPPRFALAHIDIDRFKAYNDRYGFVRGDDAIKATAAVLLRAAHTAGGGAGFVGHVGGDDFVLLLRPEAVEATAAQVIEDFDAMVPRLYDADDAARGYIEVVDRKGRTERVPLMTISVGVASTAVRPLGSAGEAAAVAVEMKRAAKAQPGSACMVDRRRT